MIKLFFPNKNDLLLYYICIHTSRRTGSRGKNVSSLGLGLLGTFEKKSRSQSYDFLFCSYIQRQRFYIRAKFFFILKTRHAIGCAVYFYKAGVATRGRRIGSWIFSTSVLGSNIKTSSLFWSESSATQQRGKNVLLSLFIHCSRKNAE
jgi:hypothetical protein